LNGETAADPNQQAAGDAEARIKLLLDKGPLAEAEEVCKQTVARFPDSDRLRALQSDIQQKETAIRKLLAQGEERLGERDFEAAAEFLTAACHLLPLDDELADRIVGILHQHAQEALEKDWEAADASLKLAARIQPGGLATPFLADALEARKHQAAAEAEASQGEMLRGAASGPAGVSRTRAAGIALAALAVLAAISLFGWKSFHTHFAHRAPATVAAATGTLIIRANIPNAEIFI
jgi:tetratricopeptide (TPR) repeat protein